MNKSRTSKIIFICVTQNNECFLYYRGKGTVVKSYMYESSAKVPKYLDRVLLIDSLRHRGILYTMILAATTL